MKTYFSVFDKVSKVTIFYLSVLIVLIVGALSVLTENVLALNSFYIFAILLSSWYGASRAGFIISLLSFMVLFLSTLISSQIIMSQAALYYITLPYAISFPLFAILITDFRNVHRIEEIAADTDNLTGISNSRSFYAEFANELLRSQRYKHTLSLAYIDIDNFKNINDTLGHLTGDELLITVANCLQESLRETDVVARLGGDEFICLLPETNDDEAKAAFDKTSVLLKKTMKTKKWDVSFSVGLVNFHSLPEDIKEAMKITDELMYSVKNSSKNDVACKVWKKASMKTELINLI